MTAKKREGLRLVKPVLLARRGATDLIYIVGKILLWDGRWDALVVTITTDPSMTFLEPNAELYLWEQLLKFAYVDTYEVVIPKIPRLTYIPPDAQSEHVQRRIMGFPDDVCRPAPPDPASA